MTVTPEEINATVEQAFPGSPNRCVAVGPDFAVAERVVAGEDIRPGGFVSGPAQFSVADAVLWYLVFGAIGIEPMAMTSELSIRFLRPAVGSVLRARATLAVAGRRNVVGSVQVWMDDREDRPVSVAQGTYARPT